MTTGATGRGGSGKSGKKPVERSKLPLKTRVLVLTEAGYRCAVPTCRGILALDMHHIWEVSAGGGDVPENLIALCPTCHALYHRGTISAESIGAYKAMLVALTRAFDFEAVDMLLFLGSLGPPNYSLRVSGDGVLRVARLIAAGLVSQVEAVRTSTLSLYGIQITDRGSALLKSWRDGNRMGLYRSIDSADHSATEAG